MSAPPQPCSSLSRLRPEAVQWLRLGAGFRGRPQPRPRPGELSTGRVLTRPAGRPRPQDTAVHPRSLASEHAAQRLCRDSPWARSTHCASLDRKQRRPEDRGRGPVGHLPESALPSSHRRLRLYP
ncbi:hypothetical protein HJG60_009189 [Phyllostomus discolor]|uniref:Uncharacterized protein n=1 Tax=Phyllostomus discolor TaxID=89673 RepID=A0A834DFV3_9CHIR|nr:hypothetical protein HJG60_009189 [Phyllostomus discolor]